MGAAQIGGLLPGRITSLASEFPRLARGPVPALPRALAFPAKDPGRFRALRGGSAPAAAAAHGLFPRPSGNSGPARNRANPSAPRCPWPPPPSPWRPSCFSCVPASAPAKPARWCGSSGSRSTRRMGQPTGSRSPRTASFPPARPFAPKTRTWWKCNSPMAPASAWTMILKSWPGLALPPGPKPPASISRCSEAAPGSW